MVEFDDVADFDAVWLPWWRRAEVHAYTVKKSKEISVFRLLYLFEKRCKAAAWLGPLTLS